MFERFTDRARKVMALANQEAQRFNHEYVGTEYILLGLVKEGSGVGANVLKNLDVDLRSVRMEVEKLVKSGPDLVMGKVPHTPRTRQVIEYAIKEARRLGHNYVGTEHLLLGLLREEDGVAAQVLMNLNVKLAEVREEILNLLGEGTKDVAVRESPDESGRQPIRPRESAILHALPGAIGRMASLLIKLTHEKDEAVRNADYETAAKLRDQEVAIEHRFRLFDDIVNRVDRDPKLAELLNAVLARLPDQPPTPGRLLIAVVEAHPDLRARLADILNRLRRACDDA